MERGLKQYASITMKIEKKKGIINDFQNWRQVLITNYQIIKAKNKKQLELRIDYNKCVLLP